MEKKSSWIVILEARCTKEVICYDCTENQAESNPWKYAEDETEIEVMDWKVISIKENK